MTAYDTALFWFRRDLRDEDNAGLFHALANARRVHCVFVFDREILEALPARADRRVEFILAGVAELRERLRSHGGGLRVLHAHAREAVAALARELGAGAVFANEDYEPAARDRDAAVAKTLEGSGARLHLAKDQAIFARDEVLTQAGAPFTVFTPYKNAWLRLVNAYYLRGYPVEKYAGRLAPEPAGAALPTLEGLGFAKTNLSTLALPTGASGARALLADFLPRLSRYHEARDFPAMKGVSYLSAHNRFGTVSIRTLAREAWQAKGEGAATWLSELIWRDFYFQILHHHPHAATGAFKRQYDAIRWPGLPEHLAAWREARTGFPIVDAAMRQLHATGYMHNRLRMVVASFLVKDLLVDWRDGEEWFWDTLVDADPGSNPANCVWTHLTPARGPGSDQIEIGTLAGSRAWQSREQSHDLAEFVGHLRQLPGVRYQFMESMDD